MEHMQEKEDQDSINRDLINQCVIDINYLKEDIQELKSLVRHTKTIDRYSVQWTKYTHHEGYYGSDVLFSDIVEPLLSPSDFTDRKIADIGSGNGRTVDMLLGTRPSKVLAIEPSRSFQVLEEKYKLIFVYVLFCI